jgi:hypothetical protein
LFAKRRAWKTANYYARFGEFWISSEDSNLRTWSVFLQECCGLNLDMCSAEQCKKVTQTEDFSNMPEFPAKGSIKIIEGIVVVKISE